MPLIFAELNVLSPSGRSELFASDPQPLDELLLYYLSPICPTRNYGELREVVATLANANVRGKMVDLLWLDGATIRRDGESYGYIDGENVQLVNTYEVMPPTDRLGGLYSDAKLAHVLEGMASGEPLPPIEVDAIQDQRFKYSVRDGIHRYYASIKHGYGKLPVVIQG